MPALEHSAASSHFRVEAGCDEFTPIDVIWEIGVFAFENPMTWLNEIKHNSARCRTKPRVFWIYKQTVTAVCDIVSHGPHDILAALWCHGLVGDSKPACNIKSLFIYLFIESLSAHKWQWCLNSCALWYIKHSWWSISQLTPSTHVKRMKGHMGTCIGELVSLAKGKKIEKRNQTEDRG